MSSEEEKKDDDQQTTGTDGLESFMTEHSATPTPHSKPPPVPTTAQTKPRKGNEVFQQKHVDGVQVMQRQDVASQDFGFEIPVDAVPLPSLGRVYPAGHPLHLAAHVEYRGMTAREEDLLMSEALIKNGTVITELIKSCLTDRTINVHTLLSGDRNALMVAIRISGYGREYNPSFACPECKHNNELQVDLASLDIKPLTVDPVVEGQNIFEFTLPKSKIKVEYRFLTGLEEEKVMKMTEAKKKRGLQNNNLVTTRLMSSIVSVNGDTGTGIISKLVSVMPAADSLALRKHIDKHEPGVKMEVEFTCSNCEYFKNIQLPMGPSFFWPDA